MNPVRRVADVNCTTVLGAVALGFADFSRAQGLEVEAIFERAMISPQVLTDPNQPMSLPAYLRAVDNAAQALSHDNFGLWLGHSVRPEHLGLWGYLGLSSATVGEALRNMAEHFAQFQSRSMLSVQQHQDKVYLAYALLDGRIVSRRHDAEMTLGHLLNVIRRALGPRWAPHEVHFRHPRPQAWHEHEKVFAAPVRFAQNANALIFNSSELLRPMPSSDPQLLLITKQSLNGLRAAGHVLPSPAQRVRAEIAEALHAGVPRVESIAERLGVATWTLNRQLKDEGVSFTLLTESVRRELACHYLEQTTVSISRLAELLGYSETSSFTHAFNRWFSCSPTQWREQSGVVSDKH